MSVGKLERTHTKYTKDKKKKKKTREPLRMCRIRARKSLFGRQSMMMPCWLAEQHAPWATDSCHVMAWALLGLARARSGWGLAVLGVGLEAAFPVGVMSSVSDASPLLHVAAGFLLGAVLFAGEKRKVGKNGCRCCANADDKALGCPSAAGCGNELLERLHPTLGGAAAKREDDAWAWASCTSK